MICVLSQDGRALEMEVSLEFGLPTLTFCKWDNRSSEKLDDPPETTHPAGVECKTPQPGSLPGECVVFAVLLHCGTCWVNAQIDRLSLTTGQNQ